MKKNLLLILTTILIIPSISFAQAPPTPATLPVPTYYTTDEIMNNIFMFPDSIRVSQSSNTWSISFGSITIQGGSLDEVKSILSVLAGTMTVTNITDTVTTIDERYENKVSTGTGGKTFVSANISITNYNVSGITFYADGGQVQFTSTVTDGIFYVQDGLPFNLEHDIPVTNPTYQCTLPASTTLYYSIRGVK